MSFHGASIPSSVVRKREYMVKCIFRVSRIISLALLATLEACSPASTFDSLLQPEEVRAFLKKQERSLFFDLDCRTVISKSDSSLMGAGIEARRGTIVKLDLDDNGLTDLLFCGRHTLALTDSGDGRYAVHNLGYDFLEKVMYKNGQPVLAVYFKVDSRESSDTKIEYDTLAFAFGGFCEYNAKPETFSIQQIHYIMTPGFGCPSTLTIQEDGSALYEPHVCTDQSIRSRAPIPGKFTCRIDKRSFYQLKQALRYIKLTSLADNYASDEMDHWTADLTVKFGRGQTKTISDYGGFGSFGLKRVYRLLADIMRSQKWRKI